MHTYNLMDKGKFIEKDLKTLTSLNFQKALRNDKFRSAFYF